jgi:hypothetical protein
VQEPRFGFVEDERARRERRRLRVVQPPVTTVEPLVVKTRVDLVGTPRSDELEEQLVVGSTAERARPVTRGERGRLVEEEELGEAAGLEQRRAMPVLEPQPARDPSPPGVGAPDGSVRVVETTPVAVHEAARRVGDQLTQRRDTVAERHAPTLLTYNNGMRAALVCVAAFAAIAVSVASASPTIAPSCKGAQLTGRFAVVPGSAGAGNIVYKLTLKNTSTSACTLTGLPAGQLLGKLHNPLATHVRAANPGALTAILVTLAPGETTFATARFSPDVPGPGETSTRRCEPVAYWFRVRAQGGGVTIVPVAPPTPVCEHGALSFAAYGKRS